MVVVDNDVISYFWLEAGRTEAVQKAHVQEDDWHAPRLWRSEFRNVLSLHVAHRGFDLVDAQQIAKRVGGGYERQNLRRPKR